MINKHERAIIKAIVICHKPFLKPEEALIYCNLGRTQFAKKAQEYGVYKTNAGYYSRAELDRLMQGQFPGK